MDQCDCYILRGDIYLLDYERSHEGYGDCYGFNYGGGNASTYQGVKVGNAVLQINLQQNELTKISREGFGMTGCYYPDLTGSTIEMQLLCTSQKNLALAFRGLNTSQTTSAAPVVGEIYTSPCQEGFEENAFVRFTTPVDVTTVSLVRSDAIPLVLDVDYTLTPFGFILLIGLPPNISIIANYTGQAMTLESIQAFIGQPKTFRIAVIGKNLAAEDDETFIYTFKKVRLSSLTNNFDILNEEFPELSFNGAILRDRLADANESPFLTVEKIS